MIATTFLGLFLYCFPAFAQSPASVVPPPKTPPSKALVGAYYFPGWDRPEQWYCVKAYPEVRHPLLGYYREGEPEVADWHIKWALEHGISFFAYDYYLERGAQMLEHALDGLFASTYINQFKFCLNWCNHSAFEEMTEEELRRFADVVITKYLTHPSYLRIEDKPVVMILSGYSFVKNLGIEKAKAAFDEFDARCKAAGLNGVYLVFCEGNITSAEALQDSIAAGARKFCLYNYPYAGTDFTGPGRGGEATYDHLVDQGEGLWKHWKNLTDDRFWPTVMAGWDRRPWTKDQDLVRTGLTPELFKDSLQRAMNNLNSDNILMIEAWNEWGEGSILEPDIETGFAYVDVVREVVCPEAETHFDVSPDTLGIPRPEWQFDLPSKTHWVFNRDLEGVTGTGTEPPNAAGGALQVISKTNDPQLNIPVTYIACAKYKKCRLRMRLTPLQEQMPAEVTGQIFWSTTRTVMSGETCATFKAILDDQWHEYEIDLSAIATWQGTTDRLRLDPVDQAEIKVWIDTLDISE